jgi:hypothetical protein
MTVKWLSLADISRRTCPECRECPQLGTPRGRARYGDLVPFRELPDQATTRSVARRSGLRFGGADVAFVMRQAIVDLEP